MNEKRRLRQMLRLVLERLQRALGLTLVLLMLVGCGGAQVDPTATSAPAATPSPSPTPSPTPQTGTITGTVLDDDGSPLENVYVDDPETMMVVAILCSNDDSAIECLQEETLEDMGPRVLDSICEADDTASDCLLHLGQGVTSVEADGSYTIADVPPGQYGLVLILGGSGRMQTLVRHDVASVQAGEITEYDIETD